MVGCARRIERKSKNDKLFANRIKRKNLKLYTKKIMDHDFWIFPGQNKVGWPWKVRSRSREDYHRQYERRKILRFKERDRSRLYKYWL